MRSDERTGVLAKILNVNMKECDYYRYKEMSLATCRAKRIFDVVGSLLGLILFSPVFLVIYCLIKREDNGPAIFKQERIGYEGKPFTLYKFRSMAVTSESDGKPVLCQKNDKRLTKIGRFLRAHHLDELPQLWRIRWKKCWKG